MLRCVHNNAIWYARTVQCDVMSWNLRSGMPVQTSACTRGTRNRGHGPLNRKSRTSAEILFARTGPPRSTQGCAEDASQGGRGGGSTPSEAPCADIRKLKFA
eukprot:9412919-Pyramimonas_sp.AAC.1